MPSLAIIPAAVTLGDKVMGPIGLARLLSGGRWPAATIVPCLTNVLI
jgi:hypothetical protein